MNKIKGIMILICMMIISSCSDYLRVEPIDRLTGNNFYRSKEDIEANVASIYNLFFEKLNESWVIGAVGEARAGEIFVSPGANNESRRKVIEILGKNDLNGAISYDRDWYDFSKITDWTTYYRVIQSVNILINKLNEGVPNLSNDDKNRYLAEASFLRNFTYFWMVRLYGDVVYYTEPYMREALARENQVTVLQKCIEDIKKYEDTLPWKHADAAQQGARAGKGSVVALLMHMNMWLACFDAPNKGEYYQEVVRLGDKISKSGYHKLLPLTDESWAEVTKGRSEESLFEFYKTINYGDDISSLAPFADHFLRWPYKFPRFNNALSHCYYISDYMLKIYPESISDKRKQVWFEDMTSNDGNFLLRKYGTNVYASGNENENPDNSFIIFRYADALLLYAEALAELERNELAVNILNQVRARAEALPFTGTSNSELKDYIFLERGRELFGEGHLYFDLIRTKRILSMEWTRNPINLDQFNRGAWTWPIHQSARNNNPKMILNEYWLQQGR
ncbi:MAG: RagB/SusD family nutrient uptake outer membrane protein [Sphingobacterium composti]